MRYGRFLADVWNVYAELYSSFINCIDIHYKTIINAYKESKN